jgi:hypothetical protein
MEKYIIRNNNYSICVKDGDYIIESDDACMHPTAEFDTAEDAEVILKEVAPAFPFDPLVVTKIDIV